MPDDLSKQLENGLESVKSKFEEKITQVEQKLEEQVNKVDEQVKQNGEAHKEDQEALQKLEQQYSDMKERVDAIEAQKGRLKGGQNGESFKDALHNALTENSEKIKAFKENKSPVSMGVKAIMDQSTNLTNTVVEPTRVPGVKYDPERRQRVRQLLPRGTTSSNAIWYIQETGFTDNTATVAEGNAKPQNDLSLTQKSAAVTKIAAHFRVSEEMLEDIDYMSSHIGTRGTEKYFNVEDNQLLYGDGTNANLDGLTTTATAYNLDQYTGDPNAQEYDVLLEAVRQVRTAFYMPSVAMMSVQRYFDMIRRKDSDGNYIMPQQVIFGQQTPQVQGVPIVPTTALNTDDFLVGDMPMLTTLFERQGVNVRMFEQDQDNAVKNLVTIVIEGRLALPTYLPNAARYGNFSNAITNAGNS